MSTTTSSPKAPRFSLDWLSTDTWAVAAAVAFIVLIVAGIFPHVPW
ncbi:MAG: hypothetical protein QOF14_4618 [Hyphomicrobiales bacterium]|jgi:hypothetical protein|nr:hypothetical protein [Hyphomicrobiales bacterium]MEA2879422.1 hypothetical protein [Hyphomicrobiales bacterium]